MTLTFREWRAIVVGPLVAAGMLLLASCGPTLEFGEVDGEVTLDGKPLIGAIVRFYPISDQRNQLPFATGTTDRKGRYSLARDDGKPGALVGQNRVVVKWPSRDMRKEGEPSGPPPEIPVDYTVVTKSPLNYEVKSGTQTINLRLSGKEIRP
jgi:hypothetical protein